MDDKHYKTMGIDTYQCLTVRQCWAVGWIYWKGMVCVYAYLFTWLWKTCTANIMFVVRGASLVPCCSFFSAPSHVFPLCAGFSVPSNEKTPKYWKPTIQTQLLFIQFKRHKTLCNPVSTQESAQMEIVTSHCWVSSSSAGTGIPKQCIALPCLISIKWKNASIKWKKAPFPSWAALRGLLLSQRLPKTAIR